MSWATGDALFEPPSLPPRPRETHCPRCGRHLLHYEPPVGQPLCWDCSRLASGEVSFASELDSASGTVNLGTGETNMLFTGTKKTQAPLTDAERAHEKAVQDENRAIEDGDGDALKRARVARAYAAEALIRERAAARPNTESDR